MGPLKSDKLLFFFYGGSRQRFSLGQALDRAVGKKTSRALHVSTTIQPRPCLVEAEPKTTTKTVFCYPLVTAIALSEKETQSGSAGPGRWMGQTSKPMILLY